MGRLMTADVPSSAPKPDHVDRMERDSLRRQLDLLVEVRNRMEREPAAWYSLWKAALVPLTSVVLAKLGELEGADPIALHWQDLEFRE